MIPLTELGHRTYRSRAGTQDLQGWDTGHTELGHRTYRAGTQDIQSWDTGLTELRVALAHSHTPTITHNYVRDYTLQFLHVWQ